MKGTYTTFSQIEGKEKKRRVTLEMRKLSGEVRREKQRPEMLQTKERRGQDGPKEWSQ